MLELFLRPESWAAIATLTLLEVVLGIDNLVFIAILTGKLPEKQQSLARRLGLALAMASRLILLFALAWIMGLEQTLFTVKGIAFSGHSLILLAGGLFLIDKATREIHAKVELADEEMMQGRKKAVFGLVLAQIAVVDIVFSLDSIITAVGMVGEIPLMVVSIVIAVLVMLASADAVSGFVSRHPTLKMLALAFLLLIGVLLVAEGTGSHFEKGYVYFAMGFSLFVETLNIRRQRNLKARLTSFPAAEEV